MFMRLLLTLPLLSCGLLAQGTPEIEPNDSFLSASLITPGGQADGAIDLPGDVDYWRVDLPATSDLKVWINPGRGASIADTDLTVLANDGVTVLGFNDDGTNPVTWLSQLVVPALTPGSYYLRVCSSVASAPGGTGTYTMDVIGAPAGTYLVTNPTPGNPVTVIEGPESNDPRQPGGTATTATMDALCYGAIAQGTFSTSYTDPAADYDFYLLPVTTPGMLELETLPLAVFPAMRNTVLYLARANGQVLVMDDDSGFGRFSKLSAYLTPGNYFAVVKGQDTGNYVLQATLTPQAAVSQASAVVHAGGCGPTLTLRQTATGPLAITELPILGSTYCTDGAGMPPGALHLHIIGTDALPQPYPLGPVAAPGCFLEVDPLDQRFDFADANGRHHWAIPTTPLSAILFNLTLEQQIAVVDLAANPMGLTISNRVSTVCGVSH